MQVIQGQVSDAAQVRAQLDKWVAEFAPGQWAGSEHLGCDRRRSFVALARFESPETARQNSDRPEQGAWWEETAALFAGEPSSTTAPGRGRHSG